MSEPKVWYRHKKTGDLGYLVTDDGETKIRLDRPHSRPKTFREDEWLKEKEVKRLAPMQVAEVSYAADLVLRRVSYMFGGDNREWLELHPEEKSAWRDAGPKDSLRKELWETISTVLRKVTRE